MSVHDVREEDQRHVHDYHRRYLRQIEADRDRKRRRGTEFGNDSVRTVSRVAEIRYVSRVSLSVRFERYNWHGRVVKVVV